MDQFGARGYGVVPSESLEPVVSSIFQSRESTKLQKPEPNRPRVGVRLRELDNFAEIAKWVDHVPFHRQEQIAARAGVALDRHKLSRWSAEVAELMLPLYRARKAELLAGHYLQGDNYPQARVIQRPRSSLEGAHCRSFG